MVADLLWDKNKENDSETNALQAKRAAQLTRANAIQAEKRSDGELKRRRGMEDERLGEVGSALEKASKSKSRSTGGGPLQFIANPNKHCKLTATPFNMQSPLLEQTRKSFWMIKIRTQP
jgi:hypothetical protein